MLKQTLRLMLLPAAAAVLVACGGGGANNQRVGQFVDDPVEGLTYVCAAPNSTSTPSPSVTNAQGQFNYTDGQVCTFRVGNVVLGSPVAVPSDGLVTPQDVAGVVRSATSAPSVTTIAQFLQSLSEPGVSGKLKISSATTSILSAGEEVQLVGSAGPLNQERLRALVVQAGKTLISPAQAEAHLDTQLNKLGVSRTVGAVTAGAPPNVLYVSVSSPLESIAVGAALKLTATANMSNGDKSVVSSSVIWSSANTSLATVSSDGTVTTLKPGLVKLTASNGNQSGVFELRITDPVAKSLTASSLLQSISNGASTVINAMATLTNDVVVAVAKSVNWVVESLGGQAVIDITGDTVSLRGTSAGDVKVKGEYQGIFANFNVTVTPVLSGTAATGAPIANAKVFVVDSAGRVPAGQDDAAGKALVTTDANGQYTLTSAMLNGLTGPFMVRVVGQMLTESGDMGPAVFHAVTQGSGPSTVNLTPLTEAHAALTLGAQPSLVFGTSNALQNVTPTRLTEANTSLVRALSNVADFSANPNFVSDPLDATPGAPNTGNARKHDATLDQLSVSVSNGKIVLADRNQDESNFGTGPRVEILASARTVATPAGAISAKAVPLNLDRAKAFAQRFTSQLAAGCDVEVEPSGPTAGGCNGVTNASNNIFHANFKDRGMTSWRWVRGWLSDAFETTDLTGVSVSVVSSTLGSFLADDGQRVYRILLKFSKGSDVVMRQILVADDGTNVRAYGNQKDFFFYISSRFNYKVDASGQYPYYPKYEQGFSIMLRPWFAGRNDAIFGAHITGPGLPTARQTSGQIAAIQLTAGVDVNRNGLASGIEVFDRRTFGCSAYAIDPSVYVERNQARWTGTPGANGVHRWRPDSTTCNPLYDFLRYDVQRDSGYTLPKKGDRYSVTLYLDASKFTQAPAGASAAVNRKNSDGVTKSVYPYTFEYTLPADSFALPGTNFNPATFGFPGVTDATRENLAKLEVGQDLAISWSRNKTTLADGAVFGSFYAGRFMSSFDQWHTLQSTASPLFTYDDGSRSANYDDFTRYNHGTGTTQADVHNSANCGKFTTQNFRGGSVATVPLIRRGTNNANFTYTSTTCSTKETDRDAARSTDPNAEIVYSNQRARKQYTSDRGRLVATSDTSQVLKFNDLISRERDGTFNFCSAYQGLIRSRQVYVQLSDVNGRQLMEMRDVWWDYPNKTPYPGGSVADRPNQATDPLFLANTSVGKVGYAGERGFVHAVQTKQGSLCVPKIW